MLWVKNELWNVTEVVDGALRPKMDAGKLQEDYINQLYRKQGIFGDGSTADAIRYTKQTGQLIGGSDHIEKGETAIRSFDNWLSKHPETTEHDKKIINLIIEDFQSALNY